MIEKNEKIKALERPRLLDLQDVTVHLQAADMTIDIHASCEAHVLAHRGILVHLESLHEAVIFVVEDMQRAHVGVRVVTGLLGGEIVCPRYLLSNGAKGYRVSYTPSTKIKRSIFMSHAFAAHDLELASYVLVCVDAPASNWRWCASLDDFRRYPFVCCGCVCVCVCVCFCVFLIKRSRRCIHMKDFQMIRQASRWIHVSRQALRPS